MNYIKYTILIITLLFTLGCTNPPDYPDEPVIEFIGLNANTFSQNDREGVLEITVNFTDGDGDIGDENSNTANFMMEDSRTNFVLTRSIPYVPEQGTGNGISGEIILRISNPNLDNFCCLSNLVFPCTPSDEFPVDTMTFSLSMVDRAGNVSNSALTEPIYFLCD